MIINHQSEKKQNDEAEHNVQKTYIKKKKRNKQVKETRQTSNRSNLSPFLLSSSLPPSSLIQHFPFLSLYISIERDCEKRNPSGSIVANKSATSQRDAFDFMESKRRAEPSRAEPSRAEQSRAEQSRARLCGKLGGCIMYLLLYLLSWELLLPA